MAPIGPDEIGEVRRSEIVHHLYQAMNRGACRDTICGQAKPMRVWLMHYDTRIKPLIERVMPGVQWDVWDAKFVRPTGNRIEATAERIVKLLDALPEECRSISVRKVKAEVNSAKLVKRPFQTARAEALERLPGWVLEGRSFVRN